MLAFGGSQALASPIVRAAPGGLQFPWPTMQAHNISSSGSGYGCGGHSGNDLYALDFNLGSGADVAAIFGGTAHVVMGAGAYGNLVWIDHGGGFVSIYAHLASAAPVDQQTVVQGQLIGYADSTGNSTGPHLHFAMHNGAASYNDGSPYLPEPMSGYAGFARFGNCTGVASPAYTSTPAGLAPSSASNSSGALGLFIQTSGTMYNSQQPLPLPQTTWGAWYSTGNGSLLGHVSAARNGQGIIEAFARGSDGKIWHTAQTCINCQTWAAWQSFNGVLESDPTVVANADGRLEVFTVGLDQALWHTWETSPGGLWTDSGWNSLGGRIEGLPAVGVNQDGTLEVFVRANASSFYHQWQTSPGGPWSGTWTLIPGTLRSDPAVGINQDGTLEIFALAGSDNHVVHDRQTAPNQHGSLSSWYDIAGTVANVPAVSRNANGTLEIFSMSVDNNHVVHTWQDTTSWTMNWTASGWNDIAGSMVSVVAVGTDLNGAIELFGYGPDQVYWHDYQTAPGQSHTSWSGWNHLVS